MALEGVNITFFPTKNLPPIIDVDFTTTTFDNSRYAAIEFPTIPPRPGYGRVAHECGNIGNRFTFLFLLSFFDTQKYRLEI